MIDYWDAYKAIIEPTIAEERQNYEDLEEILEEQIVHFINHGRKLPNDYISKRVNELVLDD